MKVILVNGSPREKGSTYAALGEVEKTLNALDIETEVFWVGNKPVSGCIACGGCAETGRCVIDDGVNRFLGLAANADGFVFGTPVHYAAASGAITSFMDRAFYAGGRAGVFALKPAAGVAVARRAGCTAAFDQLNKYFTISGMPVVSSCYWNMVFGASPDDVARDEEGLYTMRVLARNMAWLLRSIEAGRAAGVPLPEPEPRKITNFVR